jgi:hypothetical protein
MPRSGSGKPAGLHRLKHQVEIAIANLQPTDDRTYHTNGAKKPPVGAQQSKKNEQTYDLPRYLPRFIEPPMDSLENSPQGRGRQTETIPVYALEVLGERPAQLRAFSYRQPGRTGSKNFDPADLWPGDHHPKVQENSDGQHPEDDRIKK